MLDESALEYDIRHLDNLATINFFLHNPEFDPSVQIGLRISRLSIDL